MCESRALGHGFGIADLREEEIEGRGRQGTRQQEALELIAVVIAQESELLLGLDALGDDDELQAPSHRDDGHRDGGVVLVGGEVAHEGLVQLDPVDREALEVVERRIAGAEVVHRDPNALLLEAPERVDRVLRVLHRAGLGDLEVELVGLETAFLERVRDLAAEVGLLELPAGQVHRNRHLREPVLVPLARLRAGGAQHPLADRHDQARELGDRDELPRRDQAQLRVAPADERLGAEDLGRPQVDEGLEVQLQLVVGHGLPQTALQESRSIAFAFMAGV